MIPRIGCSLLIVYCVRYKLVFSNFHLDTLPIQLLQNLQVQKKCLEWLRPTLAILNGPTVCLQVNLREITTENNWLQ